MPARFDRQVIKTDSVVTTPQGFLEITAVTARTGVQKYLRKDGSILREFRPESEVFSIENMNALRTSPVTNDHPPEMVTPLNSKKFMVGFPSGPVEKVSEPSSVEKFLQTKLVITDQNAINAINDGKAELSNGYSVELESEPGIHMGEPYDVIQRKIINNHVAIVWKARGGENVRLKLDSLDAVLCEKSSKQNDGSPVFNYDNWLDEFSIPVGEKSYCFIYEHCINLVETSKEKL